MHFQMPCGNALIANAMLHLIYVRYSLKFVPHERRIKEGTAIKTRSFIAHVNKHDIYVV